jgi:hypothetical protein
MPLRIVGVVGTANVVAGIEAAEAEFARNNMLPAAAWNAFEMRRNGHLGSDYLSGSMVWENAQSLALDSCFGFGTKPSADKRLVWEP